MAQLAKSSSREKWKTSFLPNVQKANYIIRLFSNNYLTTSDYTWKYIARPLSNYVPCILRLIFFSNWTISDISTFQLPCKPLFVCLVVSCYTKTSLLPRCLTHMTIIQPKLSSASRNWGRLITSHLKTRLRHAVHFFTILRLSGLQ